MSPNLFVRNNYFYPPMHHHCHGGGNNFMNMMMGFSMIDMMWKNTFASIMPQRQQPAFVGVPAYQQPYPYQQGGFYPGLQLSSQPTMSQEDYDLAGLRQMYSDCVINKIGDKYWARSQTFVISADSILELSYKLQDKHNQAIASLEELAERERIAAEQGVQDPENPDEPVEEQPVEQSFSSATDLKDTLGEVNYNKVKQGNPAIDSVIAQYEAKLGDINKTALKGAIIQANPDIFAANGQLKSDAESKWSELQLPTLEHVRNNMGSNNWYYSGNATSDLYKFDVAKLKDSGVQVILNQYQADLGDSYKLDMDSLKNDIIKNNQGIFNVDGGLINENVKISELRIPTQALVQSKYGKKISEYRTKAADNQNLDLGDRSEDTFKYTGTSNYISAKKNSAAVLRLGNASYNLKNGAAIYTTDIFNLIDKNGHFSVEKFKKYRVTKIDLVSGVAGVTPKYANCSIQLLKISGKERIVLVCRHQYFSMDDVMCGNIPVEEVYYNKNGNNWACGSSD